MIRAMYASLIMSSADYAENDSEAQEADEQVSSEVVQAITAAQVLPGTLMALDEERLARTVYFSDVRVQITSFPNASASRVQKIRVNFLAQRAKRAICSLL